MMIVYGSNGRIVIVDAIFVGATWSLEYIDNIIQFKRGPGAVQTALLTDEHWKRYYSFIFTFGRLHDYILLTSDLIRFHSSIRCPRRLTNHKHNGGSPSLRNLPFSYFKAGQAGTLLSTNTSMCALWRRKKKRQKKRRGTVSMAKYTDRNRYGLYVTSRAQ